MMSLFLITQRGFTNFTSPGADRFKIDLSLTKKPLTDINDTGFYRIIKS
jgi:hypothetical protein